MIAARRPPCDHGIPGGCLPCILVKASQAAKADHVARETTLKHHEAGSNVKDACSEAFTKGRETERLETYHRLREVLDTSGMDVVCERAEDWLQELERQIPKIQS